MPQAAAAHLAKIKIDSKKLTMTYLLYDLFPMPLTRTDRLPTRKPLRRHLPISIRRPFQRIRANESAA